MNEQIQQLEQRISELEQIIKNLQSANTLPINIERALTGRGFVKIKPPVNKNIVQVPNTATAWVASSSGGTTTTKLIFTDGILTSLI